VPPLPDLLARVYDRVPRGIEFGLDRVRAAMDELGHPERDWGVLHVAGTNGKGSVSAISSLALQNAGYRVGLFTSPHLFRFAERIRTDQVPVEDDLLRLALQQALSFEPALTFFEVTFLAAMIAFAEARVDCAVFEVGMGGRLDATNVVERPAATAVTRIAYDHMAALGSTLTAIAFEKASIAKVDVPMVVGPMPDEARVEVRRVALARGASRVVDLSSDVLLERREEFVDVVLPWGAMRLRPRLAGAHQLDNAATAAAICYEASHELAKLAPEHVCEAVSRVSWPARLESIDRDGVTMLLDGAHNPDGIKALAEHVRRQNRNPEQTALVFGAMGDKDWESMLLGLSSLAQHRFYATPRGRTPAPTGRMCEIDGGTACASVDEALNSAADAVGRGGLVLVCGSIFLAAEARAVLLSLETDPPVAL
jgi:dihydrofolate synthase / folylpolyglutamate synthase